MTDLWSELQTIAFRRWYEIRYRPFFRTRMMWQRARHGFSDEDAWSLDHHLAHVIVGGVKKLRVWAHGYPSELTPEAWDSILAQIEEGFQVWLDEDGWFHDKPEAEVKFKEAMHLFSYWFRALWD